MSLTNEELRRHYGQSGGLLERITAGLRAAGKDLGALTHEDLAPADEFHSSGRAATRALAELAQVPKGSRVLDIGSGLGGPARYLAAVHECDVTGIDLTPEFCEVAAELSRLSGLADRTRFQPGNALDLPFAPASFDLAWTIQMQMNIQDKRALYAGIARVLKPGGVFACQEICAGNGEPIVLPVPWATRPEHSHLATPDALRALISGAGLRQREWRDITADIIAARKAQPARAPGAPLPPLGMHLVLGDQAPLKMANSAGNADAGRTVFVQGVFDKPA